MYLLVLSDYAAILIIILFYLVAFYCCHCFHAIAFCYHCCC